MTNRLAVFFGDPPEPEGTDDYYEIETYCCTFPVSREVAAEVERRLSELPSPRWITFRDLVGASHRVLGRLVYRVSECTAEQRAAVREFYRARRNEERKDRRPWEDED